MSKQNTACIIWNIGLGGIYLELSFTQQNKRTIESANYITWVHPGLHPDRILGVHDFLYMIDGSWEIAEEDTCYEIHTDDLLILSAGKHHYGTKPCNPNCKHMYIHVIPEPIELSENFHGVNLSDKSSLPTVTLPSLIHCQGSLHIKEFFEEIIQVFWSPSFYKKQKLSCLFELLLYELHDSLHRETSPSKNTVIEEIVHLIQSNPQRFFTEKELAARFFLCEKTLNNQFKRGYYKTIYAYQMEYKLEMVRQFLLLHPDVKLREIAQNFGFFDEFHLSKAFKKKYGVPPSVYRGMYLS